MKSGHELSKKKSRKNPHAAKLKAPAMQSHEQVVEQLMRRPGVRAEVKRLERALANKKR